MSGSTSGHHLAASPAKPRKKWFSGADIRKYTMLLALLAIWLILALLTNGTFMSSRNLSNLFLQTCTIGILSCGMVLVMVAGHIDISVGAVAGTLGALAAYLMKGAGFSVVPAILITLVAGAIVGTWHGYWIAYRGVPAMIATLASMTAFKGLTLGITQGATIGGFSNSFKALGQGYVPDILSGSGYHMTSVLITAFIILAAIFFDLRKRAARKKYGFKVPSAFNQVLRDAGIALCIALVGMIMISYRGIPYAVLILLGVMLVLTFIANKTPFGTAVYAIGGNREAARLSGIDIRRVTLLIFTLMGLLSAVSAIVFTARLNAATTAAGNLFEMDAIAASVIGGTSPSGGIGTIYGAIIGALVMASLDNGMSLLNIGIMYQYLIKGMILLLAVAVDFATKKNA